MWSGAASDDTARVAQWLHTNACDAARREDIVVNFWFHAVPTACSGERRVDGVVLESASPTAALPNVLPCNLAVTCIGYDGSLPPGVPTDT